ncbi:transcriptional regulatory protein DEP1 [Histoplasma ohiense]|nr:transcriptional regulatory protein DEP1 [Histoplasma ohiense (nom. inval.)]
MDSVEPAESITPQSAFAANGGANGRDTEYSIADDARSSSLSDLDDALDNDHLDIESPKLEKLASEIDSEAETERIEESPSHPRNRTNIVLNAGIFETSPSKLAQSTTYDELNDDEDDEPETSPSKLRRKASTNGVLATDNVATTDGRELLNASLETINKKRKRLDSEGDVSPESGEEEPLRKRRGSVPVSGTASKSLPDFPPTPTIAEALQKTGETSPDETPVAEETQSLDARAPVSRGKRGKKGKRKGRNVKQAYDDAEAESVPAPEDAEQDVNGLADEQVAEEEEQAEPVDEADDTEVVSKAEEELMKKSTAMDLLVTLERQFATLRDRIYDERIANLNNELSQLTEENATHPEYLRQLSIIENYRDDKIKYERTLFKYKLSSLFNKSQAERCQTNSSYFQRAREVREKYLDDASSLHYRIQQDRFQNAEASPNFFISFPTRRSQQIAQQTAYNKEVSILSGVAKYVGFPAAPAILPARQNETDEDLAKMGIDPRSINAPHSFPRPSLPRSTFTTTPSTTARPGAAEEFLEHTPWANPQHSSHEQYLQQLQQIRMNEEQHRAENVYATPAAQQRVVDLHAPNGSASTIPDHASAPNSSATKTPQDVEQDRIRQPHHNNNRALIAANESPFAHHPKPDEAERISGFRSQSSSPLDLRKPNNPRRPQSRTISDQRSPSHAQHHRNTPSEVGLHQSSSATRDNNYNNNTHINSNNNTSNNLQSSPPTSARLGLFGAPPPSRRDPSPQPPTSASGPNPELLSSSSSGATAARQRSTPLNSMHQAAGITAGGSGRSRMGAR